MKKIELLSPVGGYSQFIAAVECGADAVYLGGSNFNARNSAANFSDEELKEVIKYAHVRGVKVHLTLNILIHDREFDEAINFAKRAYKLGVDAFIVQDLGVASVLKKVIPDVKIHFSTQGTIYSKEGVEALKPFDFERVVLSRELTLDEIENVCKNSDKEIEVFVHGALCICYSGQCRFSSLIGERSGNRGKCAQPCRLKYSLYKNDEKIKSEYMLSPKDLCGVYDLVKLIKAGVSSLKIEGRLKSPEYVACVTKIYRKYIDLAYELIEKGEEDKYRVDEEDIKTLAQVFNRGGFSRGYYYGESSKELMCYERPKHWGIYLGEVISYDKKRKLVTMKLDDNLNMGDGIEIVNEMLPGNIVTYIEQNKKQIKEAHKGDTVTVGDIIGEINKGEKVYKISDKNLNNELKVYTNGKFYKKLPINMTLIAKVGEKVKIKLSDFDGNCINYESDFVVEKALNRPIDFENAQKSLSKLGDTPFYLNELLLETDNESLVPITVLNETRRESTSRLIELREGKEKEVSNIEYENDFEDSKERESRISAYLYDVKNLDGLELADRVYVPYKDYNEEVVKKLEGKEVIPYLYTVTRGYNYNEKNLDSILLGNIEHLDIFRNVKNKYCDFSFNVFNSYSCKVLKEYGVKGVNLSFELNLDEIKAIHTNLAKEVTVYGRLPLMISEHCTIGSEMCGKSNCNECLKARFYLEDRVNEKFPIITDRENCRMQILNSKVLYATEVVNELKGKCDYFRAYFLDESTEERREVLRNIRDGRKVASKEYTSGHFFRGV